MLIPYICAWKNYDEKPKPSMYDLHTHEIYEIYYFISGHAKYFIEGNIYPLKKGDIIIMKKAEAHRILIKSELPYKRIVINFNSDAIFEGVKERVLNFLDNRPLGINNRFPEEIFKETNWLYYINKLCDTKNFEEQLIYLNVLILELCENYNKIEDTKVTNGDIMNIINYINHHLTENLNLDKICNHFFISKSYINKKFKAAIGTTVWEYITTKRLLLAKEFLQGGESPTEIYLKCGFKDYCTFFRAYKSKFGSSPKNDVLK